MRDPAWGEPRADRGTQNLLSTLLGKSDAEVNEKVTTAVNRFFGIGTGEPNELILEKGYRVYYELPQDPTMAFIWAADSGNVSSALFEIDGSKPSGGGSTALTATLASGALVSEAPNEKQFVENLWRVEQQAGQYRYYQECVYLLGLLATAGRYHYDWASPAAARAAD